MTDTRRLNNQLRARAAGVGFSLRQTADVRRPASDICLVIPYDVRMRIEPARRLRGRLNVPGDKSVSHRAAIIAALARGRSVVSNFSTGADCASTLRCLEQLGVRVERDGNTVVIEGVGTDEGAARFARAPDEPLDCGNSGSTMRMLAGLLAAQPFASTLTGDASLSSRPMKRIVEPLELMGARVATGEAGRAPLRIEGRAPLEGVRYEMPVASAQVKSCVLLAGLGARGLTEVIEPRGVRTRDHTERMLRHFGVRVETEEETNAATARDTAAEARACARINGPASFTARDVLVPGDVSSSAFFVAAATLLPGSDLRLEGIGLNPTRTLYLDLLRAAGDVRFEHVRDVCREPVGDIHVKGLDTLTPPLASPQGFRIVGAACAGLIDELPLLAVVGSRIEGGVEIRDAAELRVKESDRIGATVENLRAMGAVVEEFDDGLRVRGATRLRGACLKSYGDHRIAMAFAVAALAAEGASEIEGARECVGVSFPEFFELLDSVAER